MDGGHKKLLLCPLEKNAMRANFLRGMESLRLPNGAIVAAPSDDYGACWLRDQLYCARAYLEIGDIPKFVQTMHVAFIIFHKQRERIEEAICDSPEHMHDYIHAKYHPEKLEDITPNWGHHQLDAIGLFFFLAGLADQEKIRLIRSSADIEMLDLLVQYLVSVRYWDDPDIGMWEDNKSKKTSSVGAVVSGLSIAKARRIATVPVSLIAKGKKTLDSILPNESLDRDVDMAQLSLLWPYHIVTREIEDEILRRVKTKLVQRWGLNRYWGDEYYRSRNGVSGEWVFGFFWLSIICSERKEHDEARYWFERGVGSMTLHGDIPELYWNDVPNEHTPLAWAHAMALIALEKLE